MEIEYNGSEFSVYNSTYYSAIVGILSCGEHVDFPDTYEFIVPGHSDDVEPFKRTVKYHISLCSPNLTSRLTETDGKCYPNVKSIHFSNYDSVNIDNDVFPNLEKITIVDEDYVVKDGMILSESAMGGLLLHNVLVGHNREFIEIPDGVCSIEPKALAFTECKEIKFPKTLKYVASDAFLGSSWFANQGDVIYAGNVLVSVNVNAPETIDIKSDLVGISDKVLSDIQQSPKTFRLTYKQYNDIFKRAIGSLYHVFEITDNADTLEISGYCKDWEIPRFRIKEHPRYWIDKFGVVYSKDRKTLIRCPMRFRQKYYRVLDGTENISTFAFYGNADVEEIYLPDSITSIGCGAFACCDKIRKIRLSDNIMVLPDAQQCFGFDGSGDRGVFEHCTNLHSITLPRKLKYVGCRAFEFSGLTGIKLPEGLEFIGHDAFSNTEIREFFVPKSVLSIGVAAFNTFADDKLHLTAYSGTAKGLLGAVRCGRHNYGYPLPNRKNFSVTVLSADGKEERLLRFPSNMTFTSIHAMMNVWDAAAFDYNAYYDQLGKLHDPYIKALVALEYIRRDSEKNNTMEKYVKSSKVRMAQQFIINHDRKSLNELINLGCLKGKKLDSLLELCQELSMTDVLIQLMNESKGRRHKIQLTI